MSEIISPAERPRATARLKPTKSERTRAAILDAALEFLWTHPFRDLSVQQLMSSLAVGRSAFYQYFEDMHALMENLLHDLEAEILSGANPWLGSDVNGVESLKTALAELVRVCHARGPLLRAVADAAMTDQRLERAWSDFLGRFDQAVAARIKADPAIGGSPLFDANNVATALNRMDACTFIHAFGRRPRNRPGPVLDAITHIWIATLYPHAAPHPDTHAADT